MSCQFKSNFEYRNYLTKHGANIIDENNRIALLNADYFSNNANAVNTMKSDNTVKTVNMINTGQLLDSPFLYKSLTATDKPYGYSESDMKTAFINRETGQYQMNSFKLVKPEQYIFNKQ
jgi:hypothetical protein